MQHDSAPLVNAYAAIEDLLGEVQGYVKVINVGLNSCNFFKPIATCICGNLVTTLFISTCINNVCGIIYLSLSHSFTLYLSFSLSHSFPSLLQVWLQYQSLWDMESGNIYGRLDIDLARWQKLLMDVKYGRV
jgi:hypothetical protein